MTGLRRAFSLCSVLTLTVVSPSSRVVLHAQAPASPGLAVTRLETDAAATPFRT